MKLALVKLQTIWCKLSVINSEHPYVVKTL